MPRWVGSQEHVQQACGFGDLFLWHKVQRMFSHAESAWCSSVLCFVESTTFPAFFFFFFVFSLESIPLFFFILAGQYFLALTGDEMGAGEEQWEFGLLF